MDPTQFGAYAAAAALAVWGGIERFQKERAKADAVNAQKAKSSAEDNQKIIDVKDELVAAKEEMIKTAVESKDSWKAKYETEHAEFIEYRKDAHNKLNEASARVLAYSAENGELRAKTDLSPILEHQQHQTELSAKMIETLSKINTTQDLLIESILQNTSARKILKTVRAKTERSKPAKK
jgi:hypothetical protein